MGGYVAWCSPNKTCCEKLRTHHPTTSPALGQHANWRGGGQILPPIPYFSRISKKTAACSAAVFGIPAYNSITHLVCQFWPPRSKGQVTRLGQSRNITAAVKTVSVRMIWSFKGTIRARIPAKCISRISHFRDVRPGNLLTCSHYVPMGE